MDESIVVWMDKKNKHLLSRGKMMMNKIISKSGLTVDQIIALDSTRRNQVFETAFFALYELMFLEEDMAQLDKRRVLNMSYTTMYDHLSRIN